MYKLVLEVLLECKCASVEHIILFHIKSCSLNGLKTSQSVLFPLNISESAHFFDYVHNRPTPYFFVCCLCVCLVNVHFLFFTLFFLPSLTYRFIRPTIIVFVL